jgi:putative ABC transport system substrate-binding protein
MKRREFSAILGGAVTWPLVAHAQQAMPVIGYLSGGAPGTHEQFAAAFREGLSSNGYLEGRNVAIEYRWAEGRYDRLPALAADLVNHKVDVIAASGSDLAARAAKSATSTIPIVCTAADDPVVSNLVASLARPGGNLTGVGFLSVELHPKRLELLIELVPQAKVIAILVNPNSPYTGSVTNDVQEAADRKGVLLHVLKAGTEAEIDAAFASLVQLRVDALIVGGDPLFTVRREQIVALAARYAVPAIYGGRHFPAVGGLISYGSSLTSVYRQVGDYAGKILKGAKPADLPVQQSTTFELVINARTARTLQLTVPPALLARVDEVIE